MSTATRTRRHTRPNWFGTSEAAVFCGIRRAYLNRWIENGYCPLLERKLKARSVERPQGQATQIQRKDLLEIRCFIRELNREDRPWLTPEEASSETGFSVSTFDAWHQNGHCPHLDRALKTHPGFTKRAFFIRRTDVEKLKKCVADMPEVSAGVYENARGLWRTARNAERHYGLAKGTPNQWKRNNCPPLERPLEALEDVWMRNAAGQPTQVNVYLDTDLQQATGDNASTDSESDFAWPDELAREFNVQEQAIYQIGDGPRWELEGRPVRRQERIRRYGSRTKWLPDIVQFSRSDIAAVFRARQAGFVEPGFFTLEEAAQQIGHGYTETKLRDVIRGQVKHDPLTGGFELRKRRYVDTLGRRRPAYAITQAEIDEALRRLSGRKPNGHPSVDVGGASPGTTHMPEQPEREDHAGSETAEEGQPAKDRDEPVQTTPHDSQATMDPPVDDEDLTILRAAVEIRDSGQKPTANRIAKATSDDSASGAFKRRLGRLKRRGLLENSGKGQGATGYLLTDEGRETLQK